MLPEQELVEALVRIDELEAYCKFLLGFAPKDVPDNLDPTFYHTLTYEGDCQLQERVDKIRAALIKEEK